jgi:inorganic pyrophosphatase
VLSERAITRNEIIVRARVIGGLQMVDRGEADDKIISVLDNDTSGATPATCAIRRRCWSSGCSTTS